MKNYKNKILGQFFTPVDIIDFMIKLIKNGNNILEPSCGPGYFLKVLENNNFKSCTGIEIDKTIFNNNFKNRNNIFCMDFFKFSINNKFDTIIGNPPYVKYNNILLETKNNIINNKEIDFKKTFDNRTNLYLYFIYKSIKHLEKNGELIFITPREFLKATSSIKLNKFLYKNGTITDFIELGDKKIFKNATPNVVIFRFEKNNFSRKTRYYNSLNINDYNLKKFIYHEGQIFFLTDNYNIKFNDIFYVKVGAVSGCDKCFEHPDGIDFVCSYTNKTGKTKKMLYNKYHPDLEKYRHQLLNRKIKKFNEKNWWEWGRKYYISNKHRIYVNCKTRSYSPFFIHECKVYDGNILAVFPKKEVSDKELNKLKDMLNNVNWKELGFFVDGRYIFNQRSLERTLLPENFSLFI